MCRKFGEITQFSKLGEIIKQNERREKAGKALKIVLICVGAVTILAGVGYLLYKFFGKRTDDYDLYDDLDNYYDEADHYDMDAEAPAPAQEAQPAE